MFQPRADPVFVDLKANTEVAEELNKALRNMGASLCLMTQFHFVEYLRHVLFLLNCKKRFPLLPLPGHGTINDKSPVD
jgi:hypothetical protein